MAKHSPSGSATSSDRQADRDGVEACATAARVLERAVDDAYAGGGLRPYEIGGRSNTADITRGVIAAIGTARVG